MVSHDERRRLIDLAVAAQKRAYAPYSNYAVGAALLVPDGRVFDGCNVENAAYPATICAERTAVVKAVSEGVRDFDAIAIVTADGGSPCGICRQVLNEFAPHIWVIVATADGSVVYEMSLNDLLPKGFGPANLHP